LVLAPHEATRTEFEERIANWRAARVRCQAACHQPARTQDGQRIDVEANVGIGEEMELALDNGADGIGLLRIEQLYFARPSPPTEEELSSELGRLIAPLGNPGGRPGHSHPGRLCGFLFGRHERPYPVHAGGVPR